MTTRVVAFQAPAVWWLIATLAVTAGCGDSKFRYANVAGQILLDGQPVPGAKVIFMPVSVRDDGESGPYSRGVTDGEGRYTLQTCDEAERRGAVVGPHRVIISTKQAHMHPEIMDLEVIDVPESIPWKYTYYKETPLSFEVPSGGADDADFTLVSSE